jgi:single-stranded-DNA-specific exonuclease
MVEWIDPPSASPSDALIDAVGSEAVAGLLAQRGIRSPEEARPFLDPQAYAPAPAGALPDLVKGVGRIRQALRDGAPILVWGDFDVDGQTSTALLVDALRRLGGRVEYHIPHREREGHGVNAETLRPYLEAGTEVVLTCDTGIDAHAGVDCAREAGADVVVTDHHDLPDDLPPAHALVNPKRLPAGHPLATLPGVGVAYKFVEALSAGTDLDAARYLDLAALGIVADIARLEGDTRCLLQRGLERLRTTKRAGLEALMERAGVAPHAADEEDIAYRLGPRLNAVGRLGDASVSVPLLTTDDRDRAGAIADRLEGLNDERRLLTDQVYEAARRRIRHTPELLQFAVLVIAGEDWPAGVIGIVASRLVEEYHKPAILLTGAGTDAPSRVRGSARSVEGLDITAAIGDCADLLDSYGGHPMAAGMTLPAARVDRFRRLVSRSIVDRKGGDELTPTLQIDRYVSLDALTLDLADEVRRLAPFGPGNPPVTLACRNLRVEDATEIGASGGHLKVTVCDERDVARTVLHWNATRRDLPEGVFDLAVRISDNLFRGERSLQLTWEDARERRRVEADAGTNRPYELVDHRGSDDKGGVLRSLAAREAAQVWIEGRSVENVDGRERHDLEPAAELVVGTLPPSRRVLARAIEQVRPDVVHVVGLDPGLDALRPFARRLLGLCKHAVATGKAVPPALLAAKTAHEERTVRLGLQWLEARGEVTVDAADRHAKASPTEDASQTALHLSAGPGPSTADEDARRKRRSALEEALEEARAFRRYAGRDGAGVFRDVPIPA